MEFIIELTSSLHLPLPSKLISQAGLHPGTHFEARYDGAKVIIEQLPFTSYEQAESLNRTVESLQHDKHSI